MRDHGTDSRPWWRRHRVFAGLAVAGLIALGAAYLAAPWVSRRLDRFFEELISATLNVPVVIDSVQTSPLSRLTLTRLRSVSASDRGRLEFEAREISFYYDPVELLDGRIERLVLSAPRMLLNLDADLEGIAQIPDVSPPSGPRETEAPGGPGSSEEFLPFTVAETVIQSGSAALQIEGRSLELEDLRLSVFELGRATGQSFRLTTRVFGAAVTARGELDLTVESGRIAPRYVVRAASLSIEGLEIRRLTDWLRDVEASASRPSHPTGPSRLSHPSRPAGAATDGPDAGPEPETPAAALTRLLERGSGRVSLEGTLDGVWPERLELELESTATGIRTEYSPSLGVTGGAVSLRLTVISSGRLDEIEFDVTARATGRLESRESLSDEAVTVSAKGQYARRDGGTVGLHALDVDFDRTGRLGITGTIGPLAGGTSPRVDLAVSARALDVRRLARLRTPELPPGAPVAFSGDMDMRLHVGGSLVTPRIDGTMRLPVLLTPAGSGASPAEAGFPLAVEAELEGLEVDTRTLAARADSVRLGARGIDLGAAMSWLPDRFRLDRHGAAVNDATFDAAIDGTDLAWSASGVSGALRASAVTSGVELTSEDLWLGATGIGVRVSLATRFDTAGGEFPFELATDLELEEFLLDHLHASLAGEKSELRARGTWSSAAPLGSLDAIHFDDVELRTPLSGQARGGGRLERSPGTRSPRLDLDLRITGVPTARAFATFVRGPLEASSPLAKTLRLDGDSILDLEIKGPLDSLRATGRWHLSGGRFVAGAFELLGIDLDWPISAGTAAAPHPAPPASNGSLRVRRLVTSGLDLHNLLLVFRDRGDEYTLAEPIALPLFGGVFRLRGLVVALEPEGPRVEVRGSIDDLNLRSLTRTYDGIPLEGRLSATFQPARYARGRMEWKGSIDVEALGGRFRFTDLDIDDLFQPYASFDLRRGVLEDVRLRELGSTFNFGLMSGVLRGTIEDLEIVAGELTGFRLDLETVPVRGVPQFVDRRAVKSIRRVLEGPFGDIEESLFSRFGYSRFGFTAELDDGTFRLRGKYVEEGHEYIMLASWYQFPRISIINAHPGEAYDWAVIISHLRDVYGRPGGSKNDE